MFIITINNKNINVIKNKYYLYFKIKKFIILIIVK